MNDDALGQLQVVTIMKPTPDTCLSNRDSLHLLLS